MNTKRYCDPSNLLETWFERIDALEQLTVTQTADINTLQEEVSTLDVGSGSAVLRIESLEASRIIDEADIATLKSDVININADIDSCESRIDVLESANVVNVADIAQLRTDVDDIEDFIAGDFNLSQLDINVTKDWAGYGLTNVGDIDCADITPNSVSSDSVISKSRPLAGAICYATKDTTTVAISNNLYKEVLGAAYTWCSIKYIRFNHHVHSCRIRIWGHGSSNTWGRVLCNGKQIGPKVGGSATNVDVYLPETYGPFDEGDILEFQLMCAGNSWLISNTTELCQVLFDVTTVSSENNYGGAGTVVVAPAFNKQIETLACDVMHYLYAHQLTITAGRAVQSANDSEVTSGASVYTLAKQIKVNASLSGTYRLSFVLKTINADFTAYAKLYKNGVAVGTERSTNSTTGVTYTEDFTTITTGDLLQLYVKSTAGCLVSYFRLMFEPSSVPAMYEYS